MHFPEAKFLIDTHFSKKAYVWAVHEYYGALVQTQTARYIAALSNNE